MFLSLFRLVNENFIKSINNRYKQLTIAHNYFLLVRKFDYIDGRKSVINNYY